MSTPKPKPMPSWPPSPVMATRFPSMSTRVSFGSKPLKFGVTLPSPPLAMFWLMFPPISCGRLVRKSVALRTPNFSMSAERYVSTGLGPTSSAVGMFEPVTMTRSTSAIPVVSWPNVTAAKINGHIAEPMLGTRPTRRTPGWHGILFRTGRSHSSKPAPPQTSNHLFDEFPKENDSARHLP